MRSDALRCGIRGLVALCLSLAAAKTFAQSYKMGDTLYSHTNITGTVENVGSGWIDLATPQQPMRVVLSDQRLAEIKKPISQPNDPLPTVLVAITGQADATFLAKDQFVSFSAELKNGKLVGEPKELSIFTPSGNQQIGLSQTDGMAQEKPGPPTGQFLISAQVRGYNRGKLAVTVPLENGRKLSLNVNVDPETVVPVRVADLSLLKKGDSVAATGYIVSKEGQPAPNMLIADKVDATLTEPLMSKARRRERAAEHKDAKDAREPKNGRVTSLELPGGDAKDKDKPADDNKEEAAPPAQLAPPEAPAPPEAEVPNAFAAPPEAPEAAPPAGNGNAGGGGAGKSAAAGEGDDELIFDDNFLVDEEE